MVIVAVKFTFVPEHIAAEGLLLITMVGVADELTVMVIALLTTVAGVAQTVEDVNSQVTILPFVSELVVYVAEFVPTSIPFTCH